MLNKLKETTTGKWQWLKANEMTWVHCPSPGSSLPTRKSPRMDLNPNMDNLVIGFCHQSCSFWKKGLNDYGLWPIEFQWMGLSKGGKRWSIDACPIFVVFSLFLFYYFLSFFLLVLLLLVSCYSLTISSSPFHLWLPFPFIVNWFNGISPFCP